MLPLYMIITIREKWGQKVHKSVILAITLFSGCLYGMEEQPLIPLTLKPLPEKLVIEKKQWRDSLMRERSKSFCYRGIGENQFAAPG